MLRRRALPLLISAAALTVLVGCGDGTVDQAGTADLPVAAATATADPSSEPTTAPTAAPSTTPTADPAAPRPTATVQPSTAPTAQPSSAPPAASKIPGFIAGTDLPKHPSSAWFAGKVTAGQPEHGPFCVEDALKTQKRLWHRMFGTEMDTNASQVVVQLGSEADAEAFMDVLAHAAALCAEDWLQGFPEGSSDSKDYGAPSARTHIYGVHTSVPESEPGVHLFGIGRDGVYVTVVQWGQMGDLDDAPVEAFEKTILTAVDKLA